MEECKKGKVSIIVGLFNVSRFLNEKLLSCILQQSWNDLEVILVNDGSTDSTQEICKQLAERDSRIIIINKPNGGLGSARNAGLDAASGEYVWFYDVDDEVEIDLVEKNVRWMQDYGVDMTVFGMEFIYPDTGYKESSHFKDGVIESNVELKAVIADNLLLVPNGNGFVINKFYRREFINRTGARFGWQRIQQDELFNLKLYPYAERVYVSSEVLYHYFIYHKGNNRSQYIPDRIKIYESIFDGFHDFQVNWELEDERLVEYAFKRFYQGIDNSVTYNTFHMDSPSSYKWKRQEVHRILSRPKVKKCLDYINKHNHFNFEGKLYFRAFRSSDFMAICILRIVFNTLRKMKHRLFEAG